MPHRNQRLRGAKVPPGLVLALGLVLIGVAYLRTGGLASCGPGGAGGDLGPGAVAPAFSSETLDGENVHFPEDYQGKLVFMEFWATWCPPCRGEIPHIREAAKALSGRNVAFLSVSIDAASGMAPEKFTGFVRENDMTWPQIFADGARIAASYGVSAVPLPLLIDGDTGKMLATGNNLRGARLIPTIKRFLDGK